MGLSTALNLDERNSIASPDPLDAIGIEADLVSCDPEDMTEVIPASAPQLTTDLSGYESVLSGSRGALEGLTCAVKSRVCGLTGDKIQEDAPQDNKRKISRVNNPFGGSDFPPEVERLLVEGAETSRRWLHRVVTLLEKSNRSGDYFSAGALLLALKKAGRGRLTRRRKKIIETIAKDYELPEHF